MSLPTPSEIRAYLEGYNIDTSVLSDSWITTDLEKKIYPFIENTTGIKVNGTKQVSEYYSGNGTRELTLDAKNVISLDNVQFTGSSDDLDITSIDLDSERGILITKASIAEGLGGWTWPKGEKNIKVTYTVGYSDAGTPVDLEGAILSLACAHALRIVSMRTGGGALTVQSHGRGYKYKYADLIKEFTREANQVINKYHPGVVGS